MLAEQLQRLFLTQGAESDPDFRQELRRLSHLGLRVIGCAEAGVSTFMVAAELLLDHRSELTSLRVVLATVMILVGVLTIGASFVKVLYAHSRVIGCISAMIGALALTWYFLRVDLVMPSADAFIPGNLTLILLVMVSAIPLRPLQTMTLGLLMAVSYYVLALTTTNAQGAGPGVQRIYLVFMFMLSLLATALTAVLYNQRRSMWDMHRGMLEASENMRQSETRNMLAQNAASAGRLAAALSHELNSPVGALISAVDTLLLLAARQATSSAAEQQRLVPLQNELRKSIRQSSERLKEIVARLQRFTNLDQAEVQSANVNELITDVYGLLESSFKSKVTVELDLQPVPELICRPQQLSAVFSNLLGNATEATNGDGRVLVSTGRNFDVVEIKVIDNGRGLSAEQIATIFDPGFRVTRSRVSTGNWGLYSSRQIIREHGGDITLSSTPGEGTTVHVSLPVGSQTLT
ncbi:MAG: HAMP domain-containing histidine kinase [Bryobacteraceae bacterium]|nr:HAMP domain-containing histidine kinase [Bryobacteraceae bacterium]